MTENVEIIDRILRYKGFFEIVRYRFRPAAPLPAGSVQLEVRPLIAFRDYHSTTHENASLNGGFRQEDGIGVPAFHQLGRADGRGAAQAACLAQRPLLDLVADGADLEAVAQGQ